MKLHQLNSKEHISRATSNKTTEYWIPKSKTDRSGIEEIWILFKPLLFHMNQRNKYPPRCILTHYKWCGSYNSLHRCTLSGSLQVSSSALVHVSQSIKCIPIEKPSNQIDRMRFNRFDFWPFLHHRSITPIENLWKMMTHTFSLIFRQPIAGLCYTQTHTHTTFRYIIIDALVKRNVHCAKEFRYEKGHHSA